MKNLIFTIILACSGYVSYSQSPVGYYINVDENDGNTWEKKTIEYYAFGPQAYPIYTLNDTASWYFYTDTINFAYVDQFVLKGNTNQYVQGNGSIASFPITTGKDTISGVAAMTSYVVAHNYGYVPVITLTARSADAAADHYISDIDSTTFTITFINQPPVGTDNIIFDWVATKQ